MSDDELEPRRDRPQGRGRPPRRGRPDGRSPRKFDRDDRRPRRDDGDRPRGPRKFEGDRPRGPRKFDRDDRRPRRDDGDRPRGPRKFDRDDRRPRRDDGDRPRGPRKFDRDDRRGPRRFDRDDRRPRRFDRRDRDEPQRPQTDADRRRSEVFQRKGGRKYGKDNPVVSRRENDERQVIDEGSVRRPRERDVRRNERRAADERTRDKRSADRRNRDDRRDGRHQFSPPRALDEKLAKEVRRAVGDRRFAYVSRQVGAALDAYDRERWRDAAKLLTPLLEDLFLVLDVRVIAGRVDYKLQRWRAAAEHLEFARAGDPTDMTNMPVLIDCYRALRQYDLVDQLWEEMKLVSPHPMMMAEGRVATAMSYADRGDLQSAIRIMTHGGEPSHVQPHHVLEWYVLADLHDRAGDPVTAKRLFAKVAKANPEFYDVTARLAALGDE
ncbi:MAG: hypothetical protein EBY79_02300 [Actinobacteria bacterium]|nr:hypothetical protein [Actinomycetota bacterium]